MDNSDIPDFELTDEQRKKISEGAIESTKEERLRELGEEHARETQLSAEQIIEAFPTEQKLVVDKLEEYWTEARELFRYMKHIRNIVDNIQADPFSKWFFLNVDKYEQAGRLKFLYQQIKRLEHLKVVYEKQRVETILQYTKFATKEERKKYNIDKMFARENLLVDIAAFDGIKLKGVGSRFMGLCPFHKEETPSFFIYADNWYHCYGACGSHGNFIDYLMKKRGCSFKEALVEANRFL